MRILSGIIIIISALFMLWHQAPHQPTVWYILIILGLIIIFYKEITELNFLGLRLKLEKAKQELNVEGERILLRMLVTSIILDSIDKKSTKRFFTEEKTGTQDNIRQSTEFSLAELERIGYIKYELVPNSGVAINSINDAKKLYKVTLIKEFNL